MSGARRVVAVLLVAAILGVAVTAPGRAPADEPIPLPLGGPVLQPGEAAPLPTPLSSVAPGPLPVPFATGLPDGLHVPDAGCVGGHGGFAAQIIWDPPVQERFLKEFTIAGQRYSPKDRRLSWTLRTNKTYPGELGAAEAKLLTALTDAVGEKSLVCAYFYNPEGRRLGLTQVFLSPGERLPDGAFLVFADLNVANMEMLATRVVITLCERPEPVPDMPPAKEPGPMKMP
ncbi:MAG: hypothetical protein IT429_07030 [Gemmataceae bacterium]|nr:hypothetical protein [Gemmataceae bacterium]